MKKCTSINPSSFYNSKRSSSNQLQLARKNSEQHYSISINKTPEKQFQKKVSQAQTAEKKKISIDEKENKPLQTIKQINTKISNKKEPNVQKQQIQERLQNKSFSCTNIFEPKQENSDQKYQQILKQFVLRKSIKIQELFPIKQIPLSELESNWKFLETQESELLTSQSQDKFAKTNQVKCQPFEQFSEQLDTNSNTIKYIINLAQL